MRVENEEKSTLLKILKKGRPIFLGKFGKKDNYFKIFIKNFQFFQVYGCDQFYYKFGFEDNANQLIIN